MIAFPQHLPDSDQRSPDTEALGDEIARLAAHIHATTYRLLVLLRRFDEQEGWAWGFHSCAHWLSWRTGIGPGAAREKVRVARALGPLPLISAAMATGWPWKLPPDMPSMVSWNIMGLSVTEFISFSIFFLPKPIASRLAPWTWGVHLRE